MIWIAFAMTYTVPEKTRRGIERLKAVYGS
jgi:hypothetical protein